MTITVEVPIRFLYYRGNDDPSLPVGIWHMSATLVGDASGGFMAVRAQFKEEGQAVPGDFWNLEQVSALVSDVTTRDAFLRTVGLAPTPGLPAFDRQWAVEFVTLGGSIGNAALGGAAFQLLPLFLGAVRGSASSSATVDIGHGNVTASDSLSVSMMGYRWDARSILAPGGPRRPPNGLFGR